MTKSEILHTVEALIFASGVPSKCSELYDSLPPEVTKKDINDAIKALDQTYRDPRGIVLLHIDDKVQFATNPAYGDAVAGALRPIKERELSRTLLEVLAIIAYKQPITKGELEELRGLNCDYAVHTLLDLQMIEPVGRKDAVGRPILYGTTDNFLKRFRLNSIEDLPDYDELMESIARLRADEPDSYLYADNVYVEEEKAPAEEAGAAAPSPDVQPRQGDADDGDLPDFLRDLDADDIIKIE